MALKNRDDISEFGKRLYGLIADMDGDTENEEDKIKSPKGLAKKLYDQGLVHVNTKDNFNSEYINYNNAINSIEKKIVRHINTGIIKDQQGEFVLAYSRFFNCSSDYILGLSEIKSPNLTVRGICEVTGLSEIVVNQLIQTNNEEDSYINEMWSALMESSLFEDVPSGWRAYGGQLIELYQSEARLRTRKWEKIHRKHPWITATIDRDIEEEQQKVKENRSSCDGLLYNMSRIIIGTIEQITKEELEPTKKEIDEYDYTIHIMVRKDRNK